MPTTSPTPPGEAAARFSRRTFLGGVGAIAGSALIPVDSTPEFTSSAFTSAGPVTAAMHVHGSWSEGKASWEAQFAEARSIGCNLIFMTDHDFRAVAWNYLPNLDGIPYTVTSAGSFRARTSTASGPTLRLVAESSSSAPAELMATVQTKPLSWNRLRTSIFGTVLHHTIGSYELSNGASYEVVIDLSQHLIGSGRSKVGQLSLRYRYGTPTTGRSSENGGLTGVVQMGRVPQNSTQTLDLVADARAFWPDIPAGDNGLQTLAFVVTSPRSGARADVSRGAVTIGRTGHNEAAIVAQQREIAEVAYPGKFPGLRKVPSVEVSRLDPHVNAFGVPQFFPNQADITPADKDAFYKQQSVNVHGQGGLVSWNHPFGANAGPLLSGAEQAAKRRQVFSSMLARNWYDSDILEVGYTVRGSVSTQAHFDLWDTFSRRAIFLTGNGVNDDHVGEHWATLHNGWTTGIWASSTADSAVIPALRSGRAYTRHAGKWRNGQIDLRVDGSVPMGKASVTTLNSRSLEIFAANLPAGSTVQVVRGPVDRQGTDPTTSVVASISASGFGGASHTVARSIDTTHSCFVRAQVRSAAGELIGTSNPIWLLRGELLWSIPPGRA